MVINRSFKDVVVLTYNQSKDEYGQIRQDTPTEQTIEMAIRNYKHTMTEDPRFNNVQLIGLTKYNNLSEQNEIRIDNVVYAIEYISKGRLTEVLLKLK